MKIMPVMRAENELIEQKQKQKALYKQELAWMRAGARQELLNNRHVSFNQLESDVKTQHAQDKSELNLAYSRLGKQVYG